MPDCYRLIPVDLSGGGIGTAAQLPCALCRAPIAGTGGPGRAEICEGCGGAILNGDFQRQLDEQREQTRLLDRALRLCEAIIDHNHAWDAAADNAVRAAFAARAAQSHDQQGEQSGHA